MLIGVFLLIGQRPLIYSIFSHTIILKLNSTAHIIFIDIYIKLSYEDSGKPGAQRGACGTNGVLVGDRIEFDREYI